MECWVNSSYCGGVNLEVAIKSVGKDSIQFELTEIVSMSALPPTTVEPEIKLDIDRD